VSGKLLEIKCRLCDNATDFAFEKTVLAVFRVKYYRCRNCEGLQTEQPWWLPLAYENEAEKFDTGKASRCLRNSYLLSGLFEAIRIESTDVIVDWGGGGGLLSRLMRDIGFNCFCQDRHRDSEFMAGFSWSKGDAIRPSVVTLFEVAEHFAEPAAEWSDVFTLAPSFVVGTTGFNDGEDSDWPYLSSENGQHVFLYSRKSLAWLARRFGYNLAFIGIYFVFFKDGLQPDVIVSIKQWIPNLEETQAKVFRQWQSTFFENAVKDHRFLQSLQSQEHDTRKIVIDLVFFQYHNTGIARLWDAILRCWEGTRFAERIVLIDRAGTAPLYHGFERVVVDPHRYGGREEDVAMLQRVCDAYEASVFLSSYYTRPQKTKSLMLVYDLIPEVLGMNLADPMWQEKIDAVRNADRYIAISQSTRSDLTRIYGVQEDAVSVAWCGVDESFKPAGGSEVADFKRRMGITGRYLLFVGSRSGYKNARLLLTACRLLPESMGVELFFAGGQTALEPDLVELAGGLVYHVRRLSNDDLPLAYSGALALVYPSYYEGFGLPIIEAFACGCPVITCRRSSMPEVAGDNALYIDPHDAFELARAVEKVCDPIVRELLVRGGIQRASEFRWEVMAERVRRAIRNC